MRVSAIFGENAIALLLDNQLDLHVEMDYGSIKLKEIEYIYFPNKILLTVHIHLLL